MLMALCAFRNDWKRLFCSLGVLEQSTLLSHWFSPPLLHGFINPSCEDNNFYPSGLTLPVHTSCLPTEKVNETTDSYVKTWVLVNWNAGGYRWDELALPSDPGRVRIISFSVLQKLIELNANHVGSWLICWLLFIYCMQVHWTACVPYVCSRSPTSFQIDFTAKEFNKLLNKII